MLLHPVRCDIFKNFGVVMQLISTSKLGNRSHKKGDLVHVHICVYHSCNLCFVSS